METSIYESALEDARRQMRNWKRNAGISAVTAGLLALRVLTQDSHEKTILVPPTLDQQAWIKGTQISPSYLEQQARYFAQLALTYSPDSLPEQKSVLLRYTDPTVHGALDVRFTEEIDKVRREKISEVFYPASSRLRPESLQVAFTGNVVSYVGEQQASNRHATFVFQFINRDGQLFVSNFEEAQNENDPFNDHGVVASSATGTGER